MNFAVEDAGVERAEVGMVKGKGLEDWSGKGTEKAVSMSERERASSAANWGLVSMVTGGGGFQTEPDFV